MTYVIREEEAGAIHHVWAHAIGDEGLFVDDFDRQEYLRHLAATIVKFEWNCMSYCLMGNHLHLLIETPQPHLGKGMQRLHGNYAREFNARHARKGHRFNRVYGSRRVKTDVYFMAVVRYIPLNPVRAGLCERPEDYPWSSYGPMVRGESPEWMAEDRLLWFLLSIERYRQIVEG